MFKWEKFTSHSGKVLNYKIELDDFTDDDWDCLAKLIASRVKFCRVVSVATGGDKLDEKLWQYVTKDSPTVLVVDDVLTTGASMLEARRKLIEDGCTDKNIFGVVVFCRCELSNLPYWIYPVFFLGHYWRD